MEVNFINAILVVVVPGLISRKSQEQKDELRYYFLLCLSNTRITFDVCTSLL